MGKVSFLNVNRLGRSLVLEQFQRFKGVFDVWDPEFWDIY